MGQGLRRLIHLGGGELPAGDASAPLLEVEAVQRLHIPGGPGQGLDDRLVGVVNEEHDVGQLDGGVFAHLYPGGDAGEDGALRGPDEGPGAGGKVILLQVHHADEAVADFPVGLEALNVEEAVFQGLKQAAA